MAYGTSSSTSCYNIQHIHDNADKAWDTLVHTGPDQQAPCCRKMWTHYTPGHRIVTHMHDDGNIPDATSRNLKTRIG